MIEALALLIGASYLGYLFIEQKRVRTYRSSLSHVIHVAGTRGKTTITRMIGHALRTKGVRVFTKVTGTIPSYIDTEGREHVIKRSGLPNIREQVRMMRRAYRERADILVIECMAIKEEYIRITQHDMLRADHVVIANIRKDHLEDQEGDQTRPLLAAVPREGKLFIGKADHDRFTRTAKELDTTVFLVESDHADDTFGNAAFAEAILASLGYGIGDALKGYQPDVGAFGIHRYHGVIFVNAFAVNDRLSLESIHAMLEKREDFTLFEATFLVNNRVDRPKRALEFLALLTVLEPRIVYVAGPFYQRFKRALKTSDVRRYRSPESLEGSLIIGIGNIESSGYEVIEYFQKGERIHG
ncbi:MAG: Mur ligase family protein [Acholeplasmataceae bacterium]